MVHDVLDATSADDIVVRWASEPWEIEQAHAIRRDVFCIEQGIFVDDDRDAIDDNAQLLVAVCGADSATPYVVGTVRIHASAEDTGCWHGSRLAVRRDFRRQGRIGATLIMLAVSSAHALGCRTFLATVQAQNAPLFRRLHWRTLEELVSFGREHHRMQADLARYPPCHTPFTGFVIHQRRAA
nr:MSMEG_0567/Sll0786 family nitrogen starvation N-acetyltransferase [Pandoraea terrigena]